MSLSSPYFEWFKMPSWYHFNFGNAASNIVGHLCGNHRLNSEGKRNAKCAYKNRCYNKIFVYFINKLFWLINYGSYSSVILMICPHLWWSFGDHNTFAFNSNVQNAYKHILLKEREGMERREPGSREREGEEKEEKKRLNFLLKLGCANLSTKAL